MKRAALLTIPILLALWSCSDSSLFLGRNDQPAQLQVVGVASGAMIASGDSVHLSISRSAVFTGDPDTVDQLHVELLDSGGTLLAEQVFDSVDDATDLPPIDLPDLQDGLYQLRTSYYDGETLVTESTVPFYIVSATYRIVGVTSYPASSYPGADGLVRVSLDVPLASDPYLVWRIKDDVVAEGFVSDTGSTISVRAPLTTGVFPVVVDLYPFLPDGTDVATIDPPSTYTTELVVSDSPSPARTDLVPPTSYFALYHFRGALNDDGARVAWYPSRDFAAQAIGNPLLAARADVFGYELDGTSGFSLGGSVWPAFDGELSPISVTMRLLPDELQDNESLVTVTSGAPLFELVADASGRVGVRLAGADAVWSAMPLLTIGEAETITASIVPGSPTLVSFFAGGQLVSTSDASELSIGSLPASRLIRGADRWSLVDGTTTIGAETGGFQGIVDEFGVFFRDEDNAPAVNTALFRASMRATYGDSLVYATSFDAPADAESLEIEGTANVSDGSLVLGPGADVTFPDFEFHDEDLVVTLELVVAADVQLVVRPIGSQKAIASRMVSATGNNNVVELTLVHRDGELTLLIGEKTERLASNLDSFDGVVVTVGAPAAGTAARDRVMIRSVVARRDRPQIPASLFSVDDTNVETDSESQ